MVLMGSRELRTHEEKLLPHFQELMLDARWWSGRSGTCVGVLGPAGLARRAAPLTTWGRVRHSKGSNEQQSKGDLHCVYEPFRSSTIAGCREWLASGV
jgi:hypothetical protein